MPIFGISINQYYLSLDRNMWETWQEVGWRNPEDPNTIGTAGENKSDVKQKYIG